MRNARSTKPRCGLAAQTPPAEASSGTQIQAPSCCGVGILPAILEAIVPDSVPTSIQPPPLPRMGFLFDLACELADLVLLHVADVVLAEQLADAIRNAVVAAVVGE